ALCGLSKVFNFNIQAKRFANLGWSTSNMKLLGGTQITGVSMLFCKKTSKLGALLLLSTATCLMMTGLFHKRKKELAFNGIGVLSALALLFCKKK
ncbi:hypothetical protein, partial [Commensalibacter sp. Nvir]|uniref:hypothetical protein n=1 Tax=Commensalibacter sp. Nvir TaxID=3069817 RepID=UPI0030C7EF26